MDTEFWVYVSDLHRRPGGMDSDTYALPRFCGLTQCPAVFQDQADLCFLMTFHQPAVASQVSSREKSNVLVEIIHILLFCEIYV